MIQLNSINILIFNYYNNYQLQKEKEKRDIFKFYIIFIFFIKICYSM